MGVYYEVIVYGKHFGNGYGLCSLQGLHSRLHSVKEFTNLMFHPDLQIVIPN